MGLVRDAASNKRRCLDSADTQGLFPVLYRTGVTALGHRLTGTIQRHLVSESQKLGKSHAVREGFEPSVPFWSTKL